MNTNKNKVARRPRSYEVAFKEAAVRRMLRGDNVVALSRELDVRRAVLIELSTRSAPKDDSASSEPAG